MSFRNTIPFWLIHYGDDSEDKLVSAFFGLECSLKIYREYIGVLTQPCRCSRRDSRANHNKLSAPYCFIRLRVKLDFLCKYLRKNMYNLYIHVVFF